MTHGHHDLPRRIFGDDCEECRDRAANLTKLASSLDEQRTKALGDLAAEMQSNRSMGETTAGVSQADFTAVENLRFMARFVFRSGITEEVAR